MIVEADSLMYAYQAERTGIMSFFIELIGLMSGMPISYQGLITTSLFRHPLQAGSGIFLLPVLGKLYLPWCS
jgi:hypothetical protein